MQNIRRLMLCIFASMILTISAYAQNEMGANIWLGSNDADIQRIARNLQGSWEKEGRNPILIEVPDQYVGNNDALNVANRIVTALVAESVPEGRISAAYVNMRKQHAGYSSGSWEKIGITFVSNTERGCLRGSLEQQTICHQWANYLFFRSLR